MATKQQERAIREYLTALHDPSALVSGDVSELEKKIDHATDPLERVRLRAQIQQAKQPDLTQYEDAFAEHAKAWAAGEGVTAEAFRAEGVPSEVLRKAGFPVRGGRGRRRATARRTRVSAEEVRKAIPRGTFTVKDVQDKSGASTAVARRVIHEETQAGNVTEIGPDPDHQGPGRAPTIYQRK